MKKVIPFLLLIFLLIPFSSAFAYTGGLLHGKSVYNASSLTDTFSTTYGVTDGNTLTNSTLFNTGSNSVFWSSLGNAKINRIEIDSTSSVTVTLYSGSGVSLHTANITGSGFRTVSFNTVSGVNKVAVTSTVTSQKLIDFDVFFDAAPPATNIKDLEVINITAKGVTLRWVNPTDSNFNGTKVYRGTTIIATLGKTVNSYNVTSLTADTQYTFKVTSLNTDNVETAGISINVKTDEVTTNVKNLISSSTTQTRTTLTWTNPTNSTFDGTKIYQGTTLIATLDKTKNSHTINGLNPTTSYTFKVTSRDTDGTETSGTSINVTTHELTSNVTELSSENTTQSETKLTWVNPTNPTFNGTKIYQGNSLIATLDKSVNSYDVSNLTHSTNYTFKVTSLDLYASETDGVTINVKTEYAPVKNVSKVDVSATHNRVNLSWNLPSQEGFKHVNIYREKIKEEPGFFERFFSLKATKVYAAASTKIFETNGTYFNDFTVVPESKYEYTLTTQTTDSRESEGVTVLAETKVEPTPILKDDGYTNNQDGDYVFKWTEPTLGKVKVLIDGKEFQTVDASLKQVVIPKPQMKYNAFGDPKVMLVPISLFGKEGPVTKPGGGVIENIEIPFSVSDFLSSSWGLVTLFSPLLLLAIVIYYFKPIRDLFIRSLSNFKKKGR